MNRHDSHGSDLFVEHTKKKATTEAEDRACGAVDLLFMRFNP